MSPPFRGKGGEIENRWQGSGLNFCPLPFQMPARLAVGLGLGSALFPVYPGKYAPIVVPPHPFLNGFRLLFSLI
jgi:hypothetical protein